MAKSDIPTLQEQQKMLADLQHGIKVIRDVLYATVEWEDVDTDEERDTKAKGLVTALETLKVIEHVYESNIARMLKAAGRGKETN